MHAYKESKHEKETRARIESKLPGVSVSLSSEVFPEIKEYERVSTTVVNAYVRPVVEKYLRKLGDRLGETGYQGPCLLYTSPSPRDRQKSRMPSSA